MPSTRSLAVAAALILAVAGCTAVGAHTPGVRLPPPSLTESDCEDKIPVIVASDAAAQSDIYSAVTLAGALGTDCVILAGSRDAEFPATQLARLGRAAGGYVLGGSAAVPDGKRFGRRRVAGLDRWATALAVGVEVDRIATGEADLPETVEPTDASNDTPAQASDLDDGTYGKWVYEETTSGSINAVTGAFIETGDFLNTATALFVSCRRNSGSGPGTVGASVYLRDTVISRPTTTIYWDLHPANISNGASGEDNWGVGAPPTNMLLPPDPRRFAKTLRDNPDNLLTFRVATGNKSFIALFQTEGADTTISALVNKCDLPL